MFDWRKKSDAEIAKFVTKQQTRLETVRKPLEPLMDLETKLFLPRTYDMNKSRKPGDQFGLSIYDHTPAASARKFSVGFVSQTVNRYEGEQAWLNFVAHRQKLMTVDAIKKYMQEAAEQVRYGFNRSTFYREDAFQQEVHDASVLWGVTTAERQLARDRIVFRRMDPRNHWFAIDRYGDVDIDHFKHKFTAKKLIEQFDAGKLPDYIVKQAESRNPFAEYEVIQAIYVNGSIRHGSRHNTDKPFIQFYVLRSGTKSQAKRLLAAEGVDWRPSVLRIGERLSSGYPLSMAADALTAATYGNTLSKHGLMGSHAMVQPPRRIHENLREQIIKNRLNPGSNTYFSSEEEKIEFLTQKIDPRYAEEMVNKETRAVEERFYVHFFEMMARLQAQAGAPPTATQIREAVGERIGQLTPVIEATEDDSLEPKVNTIWQHETEAGRMPDPPQQLLDEAIGGKVQILNRYNGQLAQLKRTLRSSQGMVEALAIIKEFKELYPSSLVIVKAKDLLEKMLTNRIGQDVIFNEREIAEIEAGLAEAQRREETLDAAERMAKIVPSVTRDAVNPQSPAALIAGTAAA